MPQPYTCKPSQLPCPNSSASFWHSEPNPFLLNHRTTPSLPPTADITIIGTGITGASIARYLTADPRSSNLSILVLDAREVCWGATGRNGGHCQPLLFDRTPEIASFEVKNVSAVKSYIDEHSIPCEWRSVTGCRSFWTPELFAEAKSNISRLAEANPSMSKLVTLIEPGDTTSLKAHRVAPTASGVTLTQGAGQLWPYKYVTFIIEKLIRDGLINVQTHTPVTKIEHTSNPTHPITLHTPRGSITTRHAILATNGYTSALLPTYTDLIVPVRCEMSALHPPTNSTRLPNSHGMVGHENGNPEHDDYLIQRPFYPSPTGDGSTRGGHLMFGGGRSFASYDCVGESEDDIVDVGEARYLRRALLSALDLDGDVEGLRVVDGVRELRASHQWTGIKGYSRDNMPWVGRVPVDIDSMVGSTPLTSQSQSQSQSQSISTPSTLYLCAGYTGHGMPNATLCGKAIATMVLADEEGQDHNEVCEGLVRAGELPRSYLISEGRIERANGLVSVLEQDGGIIGGAYKGSGKGEREGKGKKEGSSCLAM